MNPVGELLAQEDIRLDLDAANRSDVLGEIAAVLGARNGLSKAFVLECLASREQLGSTGVGHGVAIPHARMDRCAAPAGAFVRTRTAVAFDAPDGKPVSVFLGLIVPNRATERHLHLLATAAAMFSDRDFREKLRNAADPGEVKDLLAGWTEARGTAGGQRA